MVEAVPAAWRNPEPTLHNVPRLSRLIYVCIFQQYAELFRLLF